MAEPTLSEKLRTGNLFAEQCPSRDVLKHVTSRWGVLILVALREGTHRFSDLRRKMGGVSEKMLAQSLQTQFIHCLQLPLRLLPAKVHAPLRQPLNSYRRRSRKFDQPQQQPKPNDVEILHGGEY